MVGIRAAIASPIYLGVTNCAKDCGVKSDLTHAETATTGFAVQRNGLVPATASNDTTGTTTAGTTNPPLTTFGRSKSANTSSLIYRLNGTETSATWCVDGSARPVLRSASR